MLNRFGNGWLTSVDNAAEGASGLLGENIGSFVGGAIGGYTGLIRGAINSLLGYKYQFKCDSCGYEWGTDDASEDQKDLFLKEQNQQKILYERICKAEENNDYASAIKLLNQFLCDYPGQESDYVYKELAYLYNTTEDYEKTLSVCNAAFEALPEDSSPATYRYLYYYLYHAEASLKHIWAARKDALLVARYSNDELLSSSDGTQKLGDVASNDFYSYDESYRQVFLELPYKDRKMIMVVEQYTDLDQKHIDVFQIGSIPDRISFPIGHPVRNQLYVGHPFVPEMYVPFETYQLVFIEDKVREFCEMAQCLGATEITIEALNTAQTDRSSNVETRASGSTSYAYNSGNASYHKKGKNRLVEEISKSMSFHQIYSPYAPAHLPEKTVWYQNEPSWQRLYKQRMAGSLIEHEERIETRKSQVAEGNELNEIKGEFKTLFVEGNGEWSKSIEDSFSQQENAILSIRVKFAPLSQLTGELQNQSYQTSISQEEQEYLEMYKEYAADGEISERDRKMLDKFRSRCGISDRRARELEASCSKSQLTKDEREYLEMYKEYATDGEISERDRKMLNKMRDKMGISEERAKEIESL